MPLKRRSERTIGSLATLSEGPHGRGGRDLAAGDGLDFYRMAYVTDTVAVKSLEPSANRETDSCGRFWSKPHRLQLASTAGTRVESRVG